MCFCVLFMDFCEILNKHNIKKIERYIILPMKIAYISTTFMSLCINCEMIDTIKSIEG